MTDTTQIQSSDPLTKENVAIASFLSVAQGLNTSLQISSSNALQNFSEFVGGLVMTPTMTIVGGLGGLAASTLPLSAGDKNRNEAKDNSIIRACVAFGAITGYLATPYLIEPSFKADRILQKTVAQSVSTDSSKKIAQLAFK